MKVARNRVIRIYIRVAANYILLYCQIDGLIVYICVFNVRDNVSGEKPRASQPRRFPSL